MSTNSAQKVTAEHLRRDAFLYVRQSSLRQVFENTESTKRQYALRDRAVALGWPIERIHVVDNDLGMSGSSAKDRDGFQHLVAEVANGHAGIVLGLEVSRLARNNADWHRLIELASLTQTLILDEDGIYDPGQFNDRLLLGLKGAMSEAELHILKGRLQGGIKNKARRGELEVPLPIGLVYHPNGPVALDPDQQVRGALQLLFDTFRQAASASAVLRPGDFARKAGCFRVASAGELARETCFGGRWTTAESFRFCITLVTPVRSCMGAPAEHTVPVVKSTSLKVDRENWQVLIQNSHPGFIDWDEFERNQATLKQNLSGFVSIARQHATRGCRSPAGACRVRRLWSTHARTVQECRQ